MFMQTPPAMTPQQLFNRLSGTERALIRSKSPAGLQHLAFNGFHGETFGDASILVETQKLVNAHYAKCNANRFGQANH